MRVLGVVPARGGSKGIVRKNLALLCGKPLVRWTLEASCESRLAMVVLSTDDPEIAAEQMMYQGRLPYLLIRPEWLCHDDTPTLPVVQHAVESYGCWADAVMCLQPTNPLRTAADIDGAIDVMERTGCDSVISFTPCADAHPARMCQLDGDKAPPQDFTRRQDLPPYYLRDGSVYLVKREVLMAGSMVGDDCRAWIIPRERACNIDGPEDLDVAEVRMRRLQCGS